MERQKSKDLLEPGAVTVVRNGQPRTFSVYITYIIIIYCLVVYFSCIFNLIFLMQDCVLRMSIFISLKTTASLKVWSQISRFRVPLSWRQSRHPRLLASNCTGWNKDRIWPICSSCITTLVLRLSFLLTLQTIFACLRTY